MTVLQVIIFPQYLTTMHNLIIPNYAITQNSKKDLCKRNFTHFSSKKFITDLEKVNWDNILNVSEGNVDKYFQNFSDKIKDILDKYVPITKLSLKEMKSSNKPWLTKGTLKSINKKMIFTENLVEPKISIPKNFTT